MKINNQDISLFSAKLIDRKISTLPAETAVAWPEESADGILLKQGKDFKTIYLTFLVQESNEELAFKKISKLTEQLKHSTIEFNDINLKFPCLLHGTSAPERVQNSVFKVNYVLKNDGAIGQTKNLSVKIENSTGKNILVKYIDDWSGSAKYFSSCFNEDEIKKTIATETVCIDLNKVAKAAQEQTDWDHFFAALGIDLDLHRTKDNMKNGHVETSEQFSQTAAQLFFKDKDELTIVYKRFQKDGYPDVPRVKYPSYVWSAGQFNDMFFDLGVGKGLAIQKLSVICWSRWYRANSNGNGPLFSNEQDMYVEFNMPHVEVTTDSLMAAPLRFKLFETSTMSGKNFIIETHETMAGTPLRKYGLVSSQETAADVIGFHDVVLNGVTLDRVPTEDKILDNNICLLKHRTKAGNYCDIARVQVIYDGEIIRDFIPIVSHCGNGFYNPYGPGLYDMVTMTYTAWSNLTGEHGESPTDIMPLPQEDPNAKYSLEVRQGTGSGEYREGAEVQIAASPTKEMVFDYWEIVQGEISIDAHVEQQTIKMPAADVILKAVLKPRPPKEYQVEIVNGTGSGSYEVGETVTIQAQPQKGYKFVEWKVTKGNVTLDDVTVEKQTFQMPAEAVRIEAVVEKLPTKPELLFYSHPLKIDEEVNMGDKAGVWNAPDYGPKGDGPYTYTEFFAVCSEPGLLGQWSWKSTTYLEGLGTGEDKWGRRYAHFQVKGKRSGSQFITLTPQGDVEPITVNFSIQYS